MAIIASGIGKGKIATPATGRSISIACQRESVTATVSAAIGAGNALQATTATHSGHAKRNPVICDPSGRLFSPVLGVQPLNIAVRKSRQVIDILIDLFLFQIQTSSLGREPRGRGYWSSSS
jgi:hypothetical protein